MQASGAVAPREGEVMFTNVDANEFVMPGKEPRQREAACGFSGFVLRNVFSEHAFVALQMPFAIRPLGEPVGNPDLRVDRAGAHGDAGLIAGGDDLFETKLAVAEDGDESDEHGDLR
jgi:hypothetical protein